jgi:hypothetical protein
MVVTVIKAMWSVDSSIILMMIMMTDDDTSYTGESLSMGKSSVGKRKTSYVLFSCHLWELQEKFPTEALGSKLHCIPSPFTAQNISGCKFKHVDCDHCLMTGFFETLRLQYVTCGFFYLQDAYVFADRYVQLYLLNWGQDSSVSIATCYGLGSLGIVSWFGQDFSHPSRPVLGPTQPPTQ